MKRVCKVGDSVRDIQEGRNAGCGLVVGVLSGADSYQELMDAGAHMVCDRVTVPCLKAVEVLMVLEIHCTCRVNVGHVWDSSWNWMKMDMVSFLSTPMKTVMPIIELPLATKGSVLGRYSCAATGRILVH